MNVNEIRSNVPPQVLLKQSPKNAKGAFDQNLSAAVASEPTQAEEVPAALTSSEREYFEHLFPESTETVRSYNPYQRDGVKTPATLGTVFDRRG
jgi:hypothetical protein